MYKNSIYYDFFNIQNNSTLNNNFILNFNINYRSVFSERFFYFNSILCNIQSYFSLNNIIIQKIFFSSNFNNNQSKIYILKKTISNDVFPLYYIELNQDQYKLVNNLNLTINVGDQVLIKKDIGILSYPIIQLFCSNL